MAKKDKVDEKPAESGEKLYLLTVPLQEAVLIHSALNELPGKVSGLVIRKLEKQLGEQGWGDDLRAAGLIR